MAEVELQGELGTYDGGEATLGLALEPYGEPAQTDIRVMVSLTTKRVTVSYVTSTRGYCLASFLHDVEACLSAHDGAAELYDPEITEDHVLLRVVATRAPRGAFLVSGLWEGFHLDERFPETARVREEPYPYGLGIGFQGLARIIHAG